MEDEAKRRGAIAAVRNEAAAAMSGTGGCSEVERSRSTSRFMVRGADTFERAGWVEI